MKNLAKSAANLITGVRIACALGLFFIDPFSRLFYVLYLTGGISDVLDGLAARCLNAESKLGAKLDTIADIAFVSVVLIKVLNAVTIPLWVIIWIVCIALIKCINIVTGFILTEKFVSEHTVMNKICGALLFVIPLCIGLLSKKITAALIILTCAAASFAAVQEGLFIRAGKEIL